MSGRLAALGLVVSLLLAACSGRTEDVLSAPSAEAGTLRVVMGLAEAEWRVVREVVIAPFEAQTGVRVVPVQMEAADLVRQLDAQVQAGAVTVRITTQTKVNLQARTSNVFAETPGGDPDKVVVVGAHLDSVVEGPGINDNGSGSAALIEIARQMARLDINPRQKVRFAFWGAEEAGLLGSEHYVANLSDAELTSIYANLNFDMLGSPNYVRFVYDGDGSDTPVEGPAGSAEIEQIFTKYFAGQGLASEPTEFSGRSDYGPFIAVGIPAGGLFSGAEGIKTPEQAAVYGGTAGEQYDPCYHEACDDISNLSTRALHELGDAAAHAVFTLARTRTGFFPDGSLRAAKRAYVAPEFDFKGSHAIR